MFKRLALALAISLGIPAISGVVPVQERHAATDASIPFSTAYASNRPPSMVGFLVAGATPDSVAVTSYYAKVFGTPSKSASFIVLAEKGQRFRIRAQSGDWFQIYVMDTVGWVSRGDVAVWDPAAEQQQRRQRELTAKKRADSLAQAAERRAQTARSEERQAQAATQSRGDTQPQSASSPSKSQRDRPAAIAQRSRQDQKPEPDSYAAREERRTSRSPAEARQSPARQQTAEPPVPPQLEEKLDANARRLSDPAEAGYSDDRSASLARKESASQGRLKSRGPGLFEQIGNFFATLAGGDSQSDTPAKPDRKKAQRPVVSNSSPDKKSDSAPQRRTPPKSSRPEKVATQSADTYVQIQKGPIRVLAELSPESPILGMVNRGDHFPLISAGDSWCKIVYNGNEGWIERRYVALVDAPKSLVFKEFLIIVSSLIGLGALILGARFTMSRYNKVNREWFKTESVEKNLLVIGRDNKTIHRYLTNTTTTLQKTFAELGFGITVIENLNSLARRLSHFLPDVIAVDWRFAPNVHETVEQLLSSKASTANIFVLFYNVPEQQRANRSKRLPNAEYLGVRVTDREIFTLVTPLVTTGDRPHEIRKSVQSSALEGDIANGSLSEVFQFAEIGRKTGCLLLENHKPFGLVFFRDGLIVYAATQKSAAKEAVLEMLNLQEGKFRFVVDKQPTTTNCTIPTLGILMEWTKELDEADGR